MLIAYKACLKVLQMEYFYFFYNRPTQSRIKWCYLELVIDAIYHQMEQPGYFLVSYYLKIFSKNFLEIKFFNEFDEITPEM